jgi:hypothetical protein
MFPLLERLSLRLLVLGRALQLDLAEELLQLFLSLRIDLRFEFRDLELSLLPDRHLCGMEGFAWQLLRVLLRSDDDSLEGAAIGLVIHLALTRVHLRVDHVVV